MLFSLKDIHEFLERASALPADLQILEFRPESFGSWSAVLRASGKRFRFVFDGKENRLHLESSTAKKSTHEVWETVWSAVPSSSWQDDGISQLKSNLETI